MMYKTIVAGAVMALASMAATSNANTATLTGDTIHAYYVYPTDGSLFGDMGTLTAPDAGYIYSFRYEITGDQFILTNLGDWTAFYPSSFNGFQFVDESGGPTISGVTLDPASTGINVDSSVASWTDHSFEVNFTGEGFGPGQTAIFDISFGGVPEPTTWAMLILGVAMVGFAARRRREGPVLAA